MGGQQSLVPALNSANTQAIVACHAGPDLGIGHLARALRVAKVLERRLSLKPYLWVVGKAAPLLGLSDFPVREFNTDKDFISSLSQVPSPALVVLDLHPVHIPVGLESALVHLRKQGTRIVAVDGLIPLGPLLDLVFIPSFTAEAVPQAILDHVRIVYGWDCYLLGPPTETRAWTPGHEVLALTGGGDATSLGKTWPSLLEKEVPAGSILHWVVGPFATEPVFPRQGKIRFLVHRAPETLQPLMGRIQYAVTVLGVGFFELLRQGIPTVVFSPYGEKDDPVLEGVRRERLALVAQNESDAVQQLAKLMANPDLAARLSAQAKVRLSQDGAVRLAKEIQRLFAADESQQCGGSLAA